MLNYSIDFDYEKKYLEILKNIILFKCKDTNCKIFLFGSRARQKYRRDSDYDIGFENIDKKTFLKLKWDIEIEIEESIVPHSIDLINFDEADNNFKKYALKDIIVWKN
ncbi:MAG: hypothetical protein A2086_06035 [Spirochaetes bacterium GWD1_27_9]|nr:MAG: hypothetical protein A2Z98_10695 [Spirochaetes bacterium GWB1_27_13]OHD20349.1 MAG: hypothetical protein A2Y34_10270 [Spirochaetes bacterium GWC1_27_15]OHD35571.1 MAG: hypothetical protein A2086_06035 [Spirochaetes bacterium GWD1_27_9]